MIKKSKRGLKLFIYFLIFSLTVIVANRFAELSWPLSFLAGVIVLIFFFIAHKLGWVKINTSKDERNRIDEALKKMDTSSIKNSIAEKRYFIERAEKIYSKRKDRTTKDRINEEIGNLMDGGTMIVFLGIIMFGGLAIMFGVNNEFTNPTIPYNFSSDTLGNASNAKEVVGAVTEFTLQTIMDIGKRNPTLWFWLFWSAVLLFMIIPIFKICYFIIIKYTKGRENKNGAV